ncbi:MAG TPA: hypothetical protein VF889_04715, partial [Bacteroidota bacterium]
VGASLMGKAYLIALVLLAFGCSPDQSPIPNTPGGTEDVILPLQTGNLWILRVTEVDTDHLFVSASVDSLSIVRDTALGTGSTWYIDQAGDTMQNRLDGLWKMAGGVPALYLKYPASLNDSATLVQAGQRVSVKIFAAGQLVTVHAGQFICVAYRTTRLTDRRVVREDFYSPGYGPVLGLVYDTTRGGRSYQRYNIELAAWQVR